MGAVAVRRRPRGGTDPETFLSYEGIDIDDTAKDQSGPGFLPDIDNPRHDQIRRMSSRSCCPTGSPTRSAVRAVVRGLVDALAGPRQRRPGQELAWPMPNEVFFDLLGLPYGRAADRAQLERWVHELKDRKPDDSRLTPVAKAATRRHPGLLRRPARRAPPPARATDLVTHLVQADIDGMPFADEHIAPASEILGLMMVLFLGGVETTAGLTGTVFKLLAENPDQRDLLLADPSLIPDAVEEAIRVATPLQLVGPHHLARGHAARRDHPGRAAGSCSSTAPRTATSGSFPDPDRFDVAGSGQRHLGFGEGMHGCLGAPLARLEVKVALEEALPVLGDYTISAASRSATAPHPTCTSGPTCRCRSR